MVVAAGGLLGREAELTAIDAFLERAAAGSAALVIEGEPGIGKTTLWREAIARAESHELRVLSCRAVEAEAKLSFSALSDLLEPVPDEAFDVLPDPQRRALEVALLRADPRGVRPDPRAVATAFRSVLNWLAVTSPTLVAIDDAHWLDRSSARAVDFALRRVGDAPVALLASRRPEAPRARPALANVLADEERIELGPLSLGAVHELLKRRLSRSLPRPLLVRVHEAAQGNPFYALEIGHEALHSGMQPGDPLPVPKDLSQLVRRRVARLSGTTREALLVAAAVAQPRNVLISAVLESDAGAALEQAEAAGIVDTHEGAVRFSHPLFAAAVLASATPQRKRQLHRRLAEVIDEPEERARHLALATDRPDATVASAIDEASRAARARGASDAAAELAELAVSLTPARDATLGRRRVELADCLFHAGETERAQAILEELRTQLPPSPLRARALVLLASILHETGSPTLAVDLCEQALGEAGRDTELAARIHATWALVDDDAERSNHEARAALELIADLEGVDSQLEGLALLALVESEFYLGRGIPEAAAARALELERQAPAARVADRFGPALGAYLKYSDQFDDARALLLDARRAAEEERDESSLPYVLSHLPQLELWAGNWSLAERYAREHLALSEQLGQTNQHEQALFNVGLVEAHCGRVESARSAVAEALEQATALKSSWLEAIAYEAQGFLEWSLGNPRATVDALERVGELRGGIKLADPGYGRFQADLAEALVALGELDRARAIVEDRAARAQALDRPAALAVVARCRAVIAAAEGNVEAALRDLEEALAQHARVTLPFDLARTLLTKGQVERRAKRKAAARASLEQALAIFQQLGAPLWAEKARAELARVGLRRAASGELTETERRVAELAASGLTNREVAAQLFMSPKTVEANLARAYRKLGIHSRAELGARLAGIGSGAAQT
jgi:DNA-binding CsgD family transcriptional regulator